jgi:hypothetical protein
MNGKVYVGLHTRGKKNYLGSGTVLKAAIKKYGRENFERMTLDTFSLPEDGCAKEIFWIQKMNSKTPNGYNLNDGGIGSLNPSEEIRAKLSAAKKGGHQTEATRTKIGAAGRGNANCLGYHHTAAARANMSAAKKGGHRSAETRAKIRAALVGRRRLG